MANRDYYEILGVSRGADEKALKSAYRRLARKNHPDVNPNDKNAETRFKEISEAYQVLSDPEKRKLYDQYGQNWSRVGAAGGEGGGTPGDFSGVHFDVGNEGFGDLFESLFGQAGRGARAGTQPRRGPTRGQDIEYDVSVSFDEALSGTSRRIDLNLREACDRCHGSGGKRKPCSDCGGSGMERQGRGPFNLGSTCRRCQGEGETIAETCNECKGSGAVERKRKLDVNIPAGVRDGSRIRVGGQGGGGAAGGARGDLFLRVRVGAHPFWERKEDDLHCEVPITFAEAALGAEISVPTRNGNVSMKIPSGTQSGQTFRLSGLGAPRVKVGGNGDQYVKVKVVVPRNLSEPEQRLIHDLGLQRSDNPRAQLKTGQD